jgi:hypothetical protein
LCIDGLIDENPHQIIILFISQTMASALLRIFRIAACALCVACLVHSEGWAIPVESFDQKVEIACGADGDCQRAFRSRVTVGAYLGVSVRGEGRKKAVVTIDGDELSVAVEGSSLRGLYLSWDGDTYPEQLSSSGLGCFDLQQDGASALILHDFEVEGACGATEGSSSCSVLVETRVYDSADPTGQTYSASLLRLPEEKGRGDLLVPFSNLVRKGPRGPARLSCVGAVTIFIQTIGFATVEFDLGAIYTNSRLAMTPAPTKVAVVGTPPSPTPRATATVAAVATSTQERTPSASEKETVTAVPTMAAGTPGAGNGKVSAPTAHTPGPAVTSVSEPRVQSIAPVSPETPPTRAAAPAAVSDEEEAVYGEVIRR